MAFTAFLRHLGVHVGDHNLSTGLLRKLESAPTLFQALRRLAQMASAAAFHVQLGWYLRAECSPSATPETWRFTSRRGESARQSRLR